MIQTFGSLPTDKEGAQIMQLDASPPQSCRFIFIDFSSAFLYTSALFIAGYIETDQCESFH